MVLDGDVGEAHARVEEPRVVGAAEERDEARGACATRGGGTHPVKVSRRGAGGARDETLDTRAVAVMCSARPE